MLLNEIRAAIQAAGSIQLLRHTDPDPDALGSQFGLCEAIRANFPEKTLYCGGQANGLSERLGLTLENPSAADLTIVLDTPTTARIDGKLLGVVIQIDHHVKVEDFADIELVDTSASATCEILGAMLLNWEWRLSKASSQYLYMGLVADSRHFSTSNTRSMSLMVGSELVDHGADIVNLEQTLFTRTWTMAAYQAHLFSLAKFEDGLVYAIQEPEDYASVAYEDAKNAVPVLGNIEGARCWALFTRMQDGIHYQASLRSFAYNVQAHAKNYGGGGHICASGIKNLSQEQVYQLIEELKAGKAVN